MVPEDEPDVVPAAGGEWVGSWSAAPTGPEPGRVDGMADESIRNVVRASIGGTRVRIELSNRYGTKPVTFTDVTVALAESGGPAARTGSMRRLTFGGGTSVTVPVGETVMSDPVDLEVRASADLLVTVYSPTDSGPVTYHRMAQQSTISRRATRRGRIRGPPTRRSPGTGVM